MLIRRNTYGSPTALSLVGTTVDEGRWLMENQKSARPTGPLNHLWATLSIKAHPGKTNEFSLSTVYLLLIALLQMIGEPVATSQTIQPGIVTHLGTSAKVVALTFDACETTTPSFFDAAILNILASEKVPFTVFVGGKFAMRNRQTLGELARNPNVEFENHSFNHIQHMEGIPDSTIAREVKLTEDLILQITGQKTKFFRFPAGNHDDRSLSVVGKLGYRVVHWSFSSGDPDKRISSAQLRSWVVSKTKPGDILIFHINGRGYGTRGALSNIIADLRKKGYTFVRLDDFL
jgi:peptidoglycan-N-acetylglucosamine deacetylase